MPYIACPSATLQKQNGFALLGLLAFVSLSLMYVLVVGLNSNASALGRAQITEGALALAIEALVARAVADPNRPGSLPCPASDASGNAESPVGTGPGNPCPNYVGRFPWRTLNLSDLRDADNQELWYALSPTYRDHPSAGPLNSTTPGELSVGTATDIVAIVFSPGPPLAGQTGRPSTNVADYLEGENANGDLIFADLPANAMRNDRLVAMTRDRLFAQVNRRIAAEIVGRYTVPTTNKPLLGYYDDHGTFPYPDTDGDGNIDASASSLVTGRVPYEDLDFPSGVLVQLIGATSLEDVLADNLWFDVIAYSIQDHGARATLQIGSYIRNLP